MDQAMGAGDPDDRQLLDFIGALYDAAAEPALWPSIAVEMAQLFESESCVLLTADPQAGGARLLGATDNLRGQPMADYAQYHSGKILNRPGQAVLGYAIPLGGPTSGIVGIHRPESQAPFGERDVRRLDCLIPI